MSLGRALMLLGVVLIALGAALQLGVPFGWLGRLPGDLRIERPGLRFYFPITTCVLLSALGSVLLYLWSRLR